MADRLYQVVFPTKTLGFRTTDVLIDRAKAVQILVSQMSEFINTNLEVIDVQEQPQVAAKWVTDEDG